MSYQALYRKYRSQRFDEMVGQEVVSTTLKNAIVSKQISHAYLFSGPRGTGKTSAAKIFAKAINCPNQVDGEPCNECEICVAITKGALDDVIELDAASNNGVDEVREIRDKSTYAPTRATYKVYIIDEVHMLSTAAFNALLKTLEEPTENVVFILATTEIQKIPATILSRVQRFAFKAITTTDIHQHLAYVLDQEGIAYDDDALQVIATAAEGGMRDALSTLDQALSFSEGRLTVDEALLVTGAIGKAALADYVTAIADGDVETALRKIEEIFASGKNMGRFVDDLLAYYRELLLDPEASLPHGLIFKWIDLAVETTKLLRETTQEKTAVEVMAMRMAEIKAPTASMSSGNAPSAAATSEIPADVMGIIQGLQDQVAALQAQLMRLQTTGVKAAAGSGAAPGQAAPAPTEEGPYFNRNMVNAALDLSFKDNRKPELETAWPEIINHFTMPRERALLKTSKPVAASTDYVVVTFDTDVLAKQIAKDEGLRIQFGNYMSMIAGFAPELLALSESDWQEVRSDYIQAMGKNKQTEEKPKEKAPDPVVTEAQALFGDLVSVEDN